MSKDRSAYCRLEIYCALGIQPNTHNNIEKSFKRGKLDVYAENYHDFSSVKKRVLELTNIWLEKYPEEKAYWDKNRKEDISLTNSTSPGFWLFNRYGKHRPIVSFYKGWYITAMFEAYSEKYIEDKYGKDKIREIIKRESFGILIPEYTEVSELDLVSEKTAELFFTEWLEKEKPSEEFMKKIFTEELENREFF